MDSFELNKYPQSVIREALWNTYKGTCGYCRKMIALEDIDIEHIIPKKLSSKETNLRETLQSQGLSENFEINGLENLYVSCRACNSKKSSLLLESGSLSIHLTIANKRKHQVAEEINRLTTSSKCANLFLRFMSEREKQSLYSDFGTNFRRLEQSSGSFRLSSGMSLFSDAETRFISIDRFNELMNTPLNYSWLEGGLELTDQFGTIKNINTLSEYEEAIRNEMFATCNAGMKIQEYCFQRPLDILKILLSAHPPKTSYLNEPRIGLADINLLPVHLLTSIGSPEDDENLKVYQTIGQLVESGKASVSSVGSNHLHVIYNDEWTSMHELVRTDVDGDGVEDIVVNWSGGPVHGTLTLGARRILTRLNDGEMFKVIY